MQETRYGLKVSVNLAYDHAVEKATAALKTQGFGVLTTIDVQQTLKAKLGPTSGIVAAMAPLAALGPVGDNPALVKVARDADARLRAALDEVEHG